MAKVLTVGMNTISTPLITPGIDRGTVTFPLSMPGVASGVLMVFMPTVSTFAISEFLTNNKIKLFGTIIQENINSSMWNYGAALAFIMLIIIGITSLFSKDKEQAEGGLV